MSYHEIGSTAEELYDAANMLRQLVERMADAQERIADELQMIRELLQERLHPKQ